MEVRTLFGDNESAEHSADTAKPVDRAWIQKGDTGRKVSDMQLMLISCGYSCGKHGADGDFGNNTEDALMKFQKERGLKPDGMYGGASRAALESLYKEKNEHKKTDYRIGGTYTLLTEMKVREGAGTDTKAKRHRDLTDDGKKHDADGDGALDKGTKITCKEVRKNGSDIWVRTPSGWIAAFYGGKVYVR